MNLKPTTYMTIEEKEKVIRQWENFLSSGFKFHFFTKALYNHLILHCSFIAHFNRHGFYSTYFSNSDDIKTFLSQFKTGISVEYGSTYWLTDDEYNDINSIMMDIAKPYTKLI